MEEKTPVGSNAPIEESTEKKTSPAGSNSPSAAPAAGGSLASRWDWGRAGVCRPGMIPDPAACIGVRQFPQAMSANCSPQGRLRRAAIWRPAGIAGVRRYAVPE